MILTVRDFFKGNKEINKIIDDNELIIIAMSQYAKAYHKKMSKAVKPTYKEVVHFINSNNIKNVDAMDFMNYYERVGWKVGKNKKPMKSWKMSVRYWSKNSCDSKNKKNKKSIAERNLQAQRELLS